MIKSEPRTKDSPDAWIKGGEDSDFQERLLEFRAAREEAYIEELHNKIIQRYVFPKRFFLFAIVWLGITLVVILLQGFNIGGFDIPTPVILTMLGTALVKVFAPVLMFSNYLFGNGRSK